MADEVGIPGNNSHKSVGIKCSSSIFMFFSILLLARSFISWFNIYVVKSTSLLGLKFPTKAGQKRSIDRMHYPPINCSNFNATTTQTCNNEYLVRTPKAAQTSPMTCPEYFRWIHEDLKPWKSTGITRETMEKGKGYAHFRLVIVNGQAYVEKYSKPFQTRDVFTIWGILQLLRLYPDRIPDLELMFRCGDQPVIVKEDYQQRNATWPPPPVFHYCGHNDTLVIVFPDWTFWGWAETNIRPWNTLLEDLMDANNKTKWKNRIPYAYWKGNPQVAESRKDLMKCNVSEKHDWNARLYDQAWDKEAEQGFKHSRLQDQCSHRYKIYIEGSAWSVSEKYIMACDSMVLLVKPKFHDFFNRGLVALQHYWPIRPENKCKDIEFAIDWGNNHTDEAEGIGVAGSRFIQKNLSMQIVYDYMFHALNEYAKLLKFKAAIPDGVVELCAETMVCSQKGSWKDFMLESMVKSSTDRLPCKMPRPYKDHELNALLWNKDSSLRKIESWETENPLKSKKKQRSFRS